MADKDKKNKKKNNHSRRGILPKKKGYTLILLLMAVLAAGFLVMLAIVNALPAKIAIGLVITLFAGLVIALIFFGSRFRFARILGLLIAIIFFAVYGAGTYYLGTTYAMFARISGSNESTADSGDIDVTEDPFNIYITGIDQWNSEKGLDLERSDVNMIVTVSPKSRKILLTSIPRDSYVPLHMNGAMDKLTHTGVYGVDETIETVQDWLGIKLNYYVKMNFSSMRDIINAIGGIDVYSPVAFSSSISDYSYQEGWNHLDGKGALYFARERKSFEGKDSIRVENQQRVVKAVIDKMTTSPALLTGYADIVKAAGSSLSTNMSNSDMQDLVRMQLEDLGTWDIENQKIEGDYDFDYVASLTQSMRFLVYKTYPESEQKCLNAIERTMNPTEAEIQAVIERKKEASIKKFLDKFLKKDDAEDAEDAE